MTGPKSKNFQSKNLPLIFSAFMTAFNSNEWRFKKHLSDVQHNKEDFSDHHNQKRFKSDVMSQPQGNFINTSMLILLGNTKKSGIVLSRDIMNQDRQEVAHNQDKVMASFNSLDGLMKSIETLKDVLSFIKNQGLNRDQDFQNSHQKSEADNILSDLGVVDITTKTEAGDSFYIKTAQAISDLFTKILPKAKNIMSLIDVYLYYNRLAGLNLITPDDQVQACRLFKQIKSPLELRELESGIKIIMFKTHDPREDFKKNLFPYLDNVNGLSGEELAKKSDVSQIVAKIRLQDAQKMGALVEDNSLEGVRYFQNDIITAKLD